MNPNYIDISKYYDIIFTIIYKKDLLLEPKRKT